MVRPPRRLQELRADLAAERERLEQQLGHTASGAELAEAAAVSPGVVREVALAASNYRHISLDCPMSDEERPGLSEQLAYPDTAMESADDRICLSVALGELGVEARPRQALDQKIRRGRRRDARSSA